MDNRLASGRRGLDSGSYTDLNRLSQLKVGQDRDGEENVRKVAQEFESLFLNEMLKSMRSATEVLAKDNPLNSQASKQYQEMYDQQLSVSLAKEGGGIGLADVLVRQLSKQTESATRSNPFAQVARTDGAAWPSKPAAAAESTRDDSRLLNQRRLALPGKASERQLANVSATDPARTADAAQPLVNLDWQPATAFAAPQDKPLTVNGVEIDTAKASKTRFGSPEEFIATMMPMAEKAARRLGVEPRYLVAQAALETGWGKSMIRQKDGSNSHNLFGIKATNWSGESAMARTTEYVNGRAVKQVEGFRAYASFEQSFDDFVSLLQNSDRYQSAVNAGGDSERFVRELQKAGYATDPQYARKVSQIARRMEAYQTVASTGSSSAIRTRG
ncbi:MULTISPECIES: flagellar assembly peptidoglycan hydrolase FlgJ [Stutzerimonas stutzeri group]|jgi:flagellar protein FlgJ|uniref:flagellar assembly peptidoglycan hydrolase FlgJ n=1 Tax=Stutzerimonas stutzeri group TaxID=136846 RepID=UPI001BB008FD|nr:MULTISPECIES: flagellar assembly peptidoglycan hydrolase FlgJ [Stutzerimonas stutzeri group]MDH0184511.1 flagellar assembly peptidoglycan hydrolase FlgJ [Stutzerimonas stutzeri]MDH0212950.1 flagellar assembly peptidoglycan hydrolase FlgJ [Stutzerimonas stutzeri]MDH0260517.1 flagellar assembly peptidoglycan hydrolase FlgJ [Stutzerimonas stutzeri]MDH0503367.1 flagellar assembly peptidoglycan hydrolase FlgJ [Stutzerimonas stutzeri]MDH1250115.1 flagellar assembly peptidoglycan hydrolase FlgJ [S